MISKELLREVMGIHIAHCSECKADSDLFYTDTDGGHYINIYELAHKCKEKAYSLGFDIYSDLNGADVCHIGSNYSIAPFHHDVTEIEAIFKACEWILENKEIK